MKTYKWFVIVLTLISVFIFSFINIQIEMSYESEEVIEKNFDMILRSNETSKEISQFIVETKTNSSKINRRMIELEIFNLKHPKKAKEMDENNTYNTTNIEKYDREHMSPLNEKQINDLKNSLKNYERFTSLKENAKNSIPIILSIATLLLTEIMNLLHKGVKKENEILKHSYTIFTRVSALFIILGYYITMFYTTKVTEVNNILFWQLLIYIIYVIIHTALTIILHKTNNESNE
ncbi:hypothetical protein [Staphylococcus argenteus]|uniref:hypothetical protein n=1 Tax=Staphylococcus argenteus TaxID=985002 RepID=UPI0005057A4E|nr:hypothetical protein [Staphylococcus argenteus]MCG9853897.1 hypothetical protein [Staphylococcus argenteus]MDR7649993.1 hypothetical protein [Staphylococcus argenteus]MDR7682601.1 hypothetical protein [Staphylococcus argenteus]CDR24882.1 hypothetical protein ERS140248_02325 [Staphylococcus argenteus]SGX03820.1 Uncharacterised protein [Staphylococcus argenteus]